MDKEEAINLLKAERASEPLIRHSTLVSRVAMTIALALKERGHKIDVEMVKMGGLLHDLGRTKTHSVHHGHVGGGMLRKMGIDEKIARMTERHIGGGLSEEEAEPLNFPPGHYLPETLEEKVVCFADKVSGLNRPMPLKRTLEGLDKGLGEGNSAVKRIIQLREELNELLQEDPEELVVKAFLMG